MRKAIHCLRLPVSEGDFVVPWSSDQEVLHFDYLTNFLCMWSIGSSGDGQHRTRKFTIVPDGYGYDVADNWTVYLGTAVDSLGNVRHLFSTEWLVR